MAAWLEYDMAAARYRKIGRPGCAIICNKKRYVSFMQSLYCDDGDRRRVLVREESAVAVTGAVIDTLLVLFL